MDAKEEKELTRIFFHGNKNAVWYTKLKERAGLLIGKKRFDGAVIPLVLVIIFAASIMLGSWYSLVWARYADTKKTLARYYAELETHNAKIESDLSKGGEYETR
jgi:hypothetical protein